MPRVLIVGDGAAGVLAAARIRATSPACELVLVGAADRVGPGTAYAPGDRRHLLNVPARRMSAHADRPDHFVDWLGGGPAGGCFAARDE